ncbi:MAG: efflux RND transporter permease subunit [Flavobacteriaceae bacterium]|nr:efflux RND transporter permease subunit [Flavobacteriaceae bacterium]
MLNNILYFFLKHPLFTGFIFVLLILWGIVVAPFNWIEGSTIGIKPVAVDAIPDLGENQQIIFTEWPGRSPQDIEDQITYPLTNYLLGISGVKSVRSSSMFGFSNIYIIFDESVDYYWSRSRILERINSIPVNLLPDNVQPQLGPDATALGQVFWYTLEGRDQSGNTTGGWNLDELRSIQDFYVKNALSSVQGVAEVASVGGFVAEYQIDVIPEALKAAGISITDLAKAVSTSNNDIGARTVEINQAEYFVRALGLIKNIEDIEQTLVAFKGSTPIFIKDVARVGMGPKDRRGILDKEGAEVVGGVVIARFGANPLEVIQAVKRKMLQMNEALPDKVLDDGRISQLNIVPFYDRSELIYETLGTLEDALSFQVLITILVIAVMLFNLRATLIVASVLPIGVLLVFIAMKYFKVDANIVALSGIAIAIGTMVDLAVILTENVLSKIKENTGGAPILFVVYEGVAEVSGAIVTAVSTTIISFLPVFALQAAEGKLFGPLAYTKTFALIAALLVSLLLLPMLLTKVFKPLKINKFILPIALIFIGLVAGVKGFYLEAVLLIAVAVLELFEQKINKNTPSYQRFRKVFEYRYYLLLLFYISFLLAKYWMPFGIEYSLLLNFLFVLVIVLSIIGSYKMLIVYYEPMLRYFLQKKKYLFGLASGLVFLGLLFWLGFARVFSPLQAVSNQLGFNIEDSSVWQGMEHALPGMGKEFMPALDEGSFLLMPTSMPHSGVAFNKNALQQLDVSVAQIPEVKEVVGKAGRVESALDPAPLSMFENIIHYKSEYISDANGRPMRFKTDKKGRFITQKGDSLTVQDMRSMRLSASDLVVDNSGKYFRNWREHIHSPEDIWQEIAAVSKLPGVTSAPKLQPIETRLIMLQTGMRAPMGIKVFGNSLERIEAAGMQLESELKKVTGINPATVFADRVIAKPYLHITIDREAIARYGLSIQEVQEHIDIAIGGKALTTTLEGRERYDVRARYPRAFRDKPEQIKQLLIKTPSGGYINLDQCAEISFFNGPQNIKSEDGFLVSYVLFDKLEGFSEIEVVNNARTHLEQHLSLPKSVHFEFSGSYENQLRAEQRLSILIPLVLLVIMMILYFQFNALKTALMVFSSVLIAFSGGFILLWMFGVEAFAQLQLFGIDFSAIFNIDSIYLSVAVWVGFIALFGLATDDGVLMATYLNQQFTGDKSKSVADIQNKVVTGAAKRLKPAVLTSATTIIALLPVLTATGRGADIMIPMAVPMLGGMLFLNLSYFLIPVLYSWEKERQLLKRKSIK